MKTCRADPVAGGDPEPENPNDPLQAGVSSQILGGPPDSFDHKCGFRIRR